jgi:hypothetical protein
MGQQSLFMTPSQESFPMPQMSAYTNRNQPQQQQQHAQFGQTPPQQNTIMVSSATSSLMSTAIKPPNQNTAYGTQIQSENAFKVFIIDIQTKVQCKHKY